MNASAPAALLEDVEHFVSRFVAYPSEACRVATVLWAAHAHAVDRFESTPRLASSRLSPEAARAARSRCWSCSRPGPCTP